MALSRHRDVPLGRQQLTQSGHRRTVKDGCDGRIILLECGTCTRLVISSLTTPSWPAPMRNFRSQELRNEVVAEQCLHRGFQRRPPFSAQLLRCHIGWKRSNKLIESGSWVLFLRIIQGSWPALPELSNPSHPCRPYRRPAYAERQNSFFGISATIASVVTRRPATELASCKATLTTLAGSMMPFLIRSPYSPVWAS